MLIFFGIINQQESIMITNVLGELLAAKVALFKIQTILELADGHLTDGGLELTETEWQEIYIAIDAGLGEDNVQN
jgi:hypothetical protein